MTARTDIAPIWPDELRQWISQHRTPRQAAAILNETVNHKSAPTDRRTPS